MALAVALSQVPSAHATTVVNGNILIGTGSCVFECTLFKATCPNLPPGNGTTSEIIDLTPYRGRTVTVSVDSSGWTARTIASDCSTAQDYAVQVGNPFRIVAASYLALSPPLGATNSAFEVYVS